MKENNLYPKSYGAWNGNPRGSTPDLTRCCVEVWSSDRWGRGHQCARKRGHGPEEAYCAQHDPAAVAERRKKANDEYKARTNKERYFWHGRTFYNALKKIAEGHNDPGTLAREVLETFHSKELK